MDLYLWWIVYVGISAVERHEWVRDRKTKTSSAGEDAWGGETPSKWTHRTAGEETGKTENAGQWIEFSKVTA